jgi:heme exporter protein A
MLRVVNLSCSKGERILFSGVQTELKPGEILHVRGENGVGKTSLLRMVVGLSTPAAGDILWNDVPISRCRESYLENLLFLGHHSALKADLTATENLRFSSSIDGMALTQGAVTAVLGQFGLKGREQFPIEWLSAGQKRRVLLARLSLRSAKLWVLDEPFNALDINATEFLLQMIADHLAADGMVLMTSHQSLALSNVRVLSL